MYTLHGYAQPGTHKNLTALPSNEACLYIQHGREPVCQLADVDASRQTAVKAGCMQVSKSFAIGWHATLDIIAKLLEAKLLPMATAVKATAKLPSQRPTAQCCHPKAARFFLQKGGRRVIPGILSLLGPNNAVSLYTQYLLLAVTQLWFSCCLYVDVLRRVVPSELPSAHALLQDRAKPGSSAFPATQTESATAE